MKTARALTALAMLFIGIGRSDANAQAVRITPVGSHTGELCLNDRGFLFEDPTGVRVLYDVGTAVAGATDPRLGEVHVVLLSHAHGDHIGNMKAAGVDAGTCAKPETVSAEPNSNTVEIAAAKNAAVVVSNSLTSFLANKIAKIKTLATPACPADGLAREMTVPRPTTCVGNIQLGGKRMIKRAGQQNGVQIALVRADHSNDVPLSLLTGPQRDSLGVDNLAAYVGQANGYVLSFTNGLHVYLSGDTAIFGDMKTIIKDFYQVNLVVINMGAFATQGEEAAFAVDQLIRPASVIPSHVNEAATDQGVVRQGSKTKQFLDLVKSSRVYVPRSGKTMEFSGDGTCLAGC